MISGDIIITYLDNCRKRQQLDTILQTYNLTGTISFPTCRTNASTTAVENIFITRTKNYIINTHINGISDYEAQIIVIENIVPIKQRNNITTKRDINDQSTHEAACRQYVWSSMSTVHMEQHVDSTYGAACRQYIWSSMPTVHMD